MSQSFSVTDAKHAVMRRITATDDDIIEITILDPGIDGDPRHMVTLAARDARTGMPVSEAMLSSDSLEHLYIWLLDEGVVASRK